MRFARHFLLATLAFGAAACSDEDLGPTRAAVPPLAYVRYINAVPDTFPHTVRWTDDIEFTPMTFVNVGFRTEAQGAWQGLRAGNRDFKVFTYQQNTNNFPVAGNTTELADTTFNFVAGSYYTILFTGYSRTGSTPAAQLRIIEDTPPASPATGTLVRVYNLAYEGDWDVYLGGTATLAGDTDTLSLAYAAAPGTLIASTTAAGAGSVLVPYAAQALGTYQLRLTVGGTLNRPGVMNPATPVRVSVPVGLAETADFEAAGGSNIAGSVLTYWVFGRAATGTGAATRPSVMVTVDRSPARTIAP